MASNWMSDWTRDNKLMHGSIYGSCGLGKLSIIKPGFDVELFAGGAELDLEI